MMENEQNVFSTFQIESGDKERVSFENLVFIQINRINQILSAKYNEYESTERRKQFNFAVEGLDMILEPLKDEQFVADTKTATDAWEKEIPEWHKKHKDSDCPSDKNIVRAKSVQAYSKYSKILFRQLMKLLQRKGRLFKQTGEGVV